MISETNTLGLFWKESSVDILDTKGQVLRTKVFP